MWRFVHGSDLTEAKDAHGVEFGLNRVTQIVERAANRPPADIRDQLVGAARLWADTQEDDVTVLVVRRTD